MLEQKISKNYTSDHSKMSQGNSFQHTITTGMRHLRSMIMNTEPLQLAGNIKFKGVFAMLATSEVPKERNVTPTLLNAFLGTELKKTLCFQFFGAKLDFVIFCN